MIHLTKAFRKMLAEDRRDYLARAVIKLADSTRLNVDNTHIWSDGFGVEDAVSDDESFTALGATIINAATLILDNTKDAYTEYDFMNADVEMYIAAYVQDGTTTRKEEVKMGTFRVDDPQYNEATITLSMLDYMEQFDRPYKSSTLRYPATLGAIYRDACQMCGVTAGSTSFPHDDFVVETRPQDDALTYREVISWVATIAGCFARCNRDGELEIKWFNTQALEDDSGTDGGVFDAGTPYYNTGDSLDGGSFNPWNDGATADGGTFTESFPLQYIGKLYSQNIAVDETVITGVSATIDNEDSDAEEKTLTYMAGSSGYVVQITKNKFMTSSNCNEIVDWLGQQLIGLKFRKCNVTHADDPSIEAGDVGLLFDSRQREYPILITRQSFDISGPQTIVCGSETPSRNSSTRFTESTKNFVESRKLLKEQKDAYDLAMEKLAEDIENNAHGLYAEEIDDEDNPGAKIYCLHDKPELDDSDVRIHVSTIGIAVTSNGTAEKPDWYAFRVNGDLIARIMNTIGINFDWGVGGELTIKKGDNEVFYADADTGIVRITSKKDNQTVFYLDTQTGTVDIVANSFSLSGGKTIQDIADDSADAKLQEFLTTYSSDINDINSQIDKKAETWYQSTTPSTSWTEEEKTEHVGDLWYCTAENGDYKKNQTYRWNGTSWVKQDAPDEVFDKIDGKAQIFTTTPVPPYNKGDLWFGSSGSDIMTCITARASGSYTASDWEKRNKYTDDSAVDTLNEDLDQEEIFNRLTNNKATKGIILQDGNLYINATYINSGTMSAARIKGGLLTMGGDENANGRIIIRDKDDNIVGRWDKDGIDILKGVITLGGSGNAGKLIVNNESGTEIGRWDKNGISVLDGSIKGSTITLGGYNNENGALYLKGPDGETNLMTLGKSGIHVYAGTIQGPNVIVGGEDNKNGQIVVRNASGQNIGRWNKDGITVTTGSISGNLITAGKIQSKTGGTYFDLDKDELVCNKLKNSGNTLTVASEPLLGQTEDAFSFSRGYESRAIYISPSTAIPFIACKTQLNICKVDGNGNQKGYISLDNGYVDLGFGNNNNLELTSDGKISTGGNVTQVDLPDNTRVYRNGAYTKVEVVSSSSKRYKHDIKHKFTGDRAEENLLNLPVAEFIYNDDSPIQYSDMRGKTIPGIIAEDVAEHYPSAVIRNDDGDVESWDERRIIPGMLALIQEQDKKLKEQEVEIDDLKKRMVKLEETVNKLLGKEE